MDIGQLLSRMMGDMRVAESDTKTLELKVGQIVRGLILQMLSEQDALVSIEGVQVKAKLEAPFQSGQHTWLQVQPESQNGQVVLKAVNGGPNLFKEDMLPQLMRLLGWKDTTINRELARLTQQLQLDSGNKDVKSLAGFMSERPGNIAEDTWMKSAALTVQRGLPLTVETVRSIAQVISGKPLPQLLQAALNELEQMLPQSSAAGRGSSGAIAGQAGQEPVAKLVNAIRVWLAQAGMPESANYTATDKPSMPSTDQVKWNMAGQGLAQGQAEESGRSTAANIQHSVQGGQNTQATAANNAIQGGERATASAGFVRLTDESPPFQEMRSRPTGTSMQESAVVKPQDQAVHAGPTRIPLDGLNIARLLHSLGMNHEHEAVQRFMQPSQLGHEARGLLPVTGELLETAERGSPNAGSQANAVETIKSLLLQIIHNEQLPTALRDLAQQTISNIAGQQLFLSADRAAPFSYVTMFVPFVNEQGEHLASVHIQSRKGKSGQLDSKNCHLLFDLHLSVLGDMIIDVQVTDRLVALHIHNDHVLTNKLVENGKAEITDALGKVGYRLASVRSSAYPSDTQVTNSGDGNKSGNFTKYAAAKPYKGVDLRI